MNNTHDVFFDDVSKIMRSMNPIVTKELTLKEAWTMNFVTSFLAVLTSLFAGLYWTLLILIGIGLVISYDVKPIRMKDRPSGIVMIPLYNSLSFLFACLNSASSLIFSPSTLVIFAFFFVNGITSIRHVPDFEKDRQMNVYNFTARYDVEATRILELVVTIMLPVLIFTAIIFNYVSFFGLPILLFAITLRLSVLKKSNKVLADPQVWKRFGQLMIVNSSAMMLSIVSKNLVF